MIRQNGGSIERMGATHAALWPTGQALVSLFDPFDAPNAAFFSCLATRAQDRNRFALIYKVLPNAKVAWRDVLVGAGVATLLLAVGMSLVKLILSGNRFSSALEAAGAVAVFLMAFYYLGQIFVLGAVVIRVFASMSGSKIVPREDPDPSGNS